MIWWYLRARFALWLLRAAGRLLRWLVLAAVLAAAAPVTLVAAVGLAGAWLCGWPPARLRRAAAWSLPMTAAYLAARGLRADSWHAFALAPARDWQAAWDQASAGHVVAAFALTAPVAVPAGLAAAAGLWAWRIYAIETGLSGRTASAPVVFDARQWRRAARKYTGYMVFGRQRTLKSGRTVPVPPAEWLWSPEPAHPAIITRATFDAAQAIGAEHSTSRDGTGPNPHRQTRRTYILRGRIRCRSCQRRMSGITRTSPRYWADGPDYSNTYYACHHDPANPRHTAKQGHPRSISVREDALLEVIRHFFNERIFGPDRANLLAADLPASAADDQARRDAQAAALHKRLRQIDAAENAHAREIEALTHDTPDVPAQAITALRSRILARFTELEDERTQISAQLHDLAQSAPAAADPALLDALPMLGDLLDGAPARLQQQLYSAFDIQALYNKNMHQVTIFATITDSTPRTLAAIMKDAGDGPTASLSDSAPEPAFRIWHKPLYVTQLPGSRVGGVDRRSLGRS